MTTGPRQEDVATRPLTSSERALLDALLGHAFDGVEQLRVQARRVTASPGCTCGCGTLDLHVPDTVPLSPATGPVPVEGTVVGADGEPVGGVLLVVDGGRLSCLEVYPLGSEPLPLPDPLRVRWHTGA
ncbi:hypothetical protein ACI78V_22840 [Geodermatophilus sp. SYSU D00742]